MTPSPSPVACRVCAEPVPSESLTCPHCNAPRPALAEFHGEGYEHRSTATWLGYPLLHIAFGMDAEGRVRTARGIVAIGQRARGGIAIGIIATGFIAIGIVAIGAFSLGVVALAAVAGIGANAIAPFALGVVALGYWADGIAALSLHN